jgi:phospholipid N-methyltransferase
MQSPPSSHISAIEEHLVASILSAEAKRQYALGDVSTKELLPFINLLREISAAYVSHETGQRLPSPITSNTDAKAYALYYTPINAAKVLHLLNYVTPQSENLKVLDLGSGPGTASLALLSHFKGSVELTCIESSKEMRSAAKELVSTFRGRAQLSSLTFCESLGALKSDEKFDLIIAANVFAEMPDTEAQKSLDILAKAINETGYLMLIEPGQFNHTRRLMTLRDRITELYKTFAPIFPCLRNDRCPMLLESTSDWCHGTLEWQQPRLNAQIDDLLGFNKHRIKFSSFIFRNHGALLEGARVLTPPEKTRAGVEALICSKDLYGIARIPKRIRSAETTRPFEKARVYDRLIISPPFIGEAPEGVVVKRATQD